MSAQRPRRALHVFATFGVGGPQVRQCAVIARMGQGWRHDVVAMDEVYAAADRAPSGLLGERIAPPRGSMVGNVRAFLSLLRQRKPDLLLTYNWGSIEAALAARILDLRRHVHHEEGFGPGEQTRRHWRRNFLRRVALGRAHAVVVVSSRLCDIARSEWRIPEQQLRYLPNGVDVARFAPAQAALPAGPCKIVAVGGLRPEKDYATLLQAFAAMRQPAQLSLVGDGPEGAALRQLAATLGIAERVQFQGNVDDTAPWLREADVFALSSRTEQMPISLLEAMATGLPAASTDVGDVRSMLPDGSRSALVPPGDAAGLAAALDALCADPARRRREGLANRQRCEREFEVGSCLDRFVALYEQAAGG